MLPPQRYGSGVTCALVGSCEKRLASKVKGKRILFFNLGVELYLILGVYFVLFAVLIKVHRFHIRSFGLGVTVVLVDFQYQ